MDNKDFDVASALEAMEQLNFSSIEPLSVESEEDNIQDINIYDISMIKDYGIFLQEAGQSLANIYQQLTIHTQQVCEEAWGEDKVRRGFMNEFEQIRDEIDKLAKDIQECSIYIKRFYDRLEQLDALKES